MEVIVEYKISYIYDNLSNKLPIRKICLTKFKVPM